MTYMDGCGVDLSHITWRRSSYSGNQGNCVEVADNVPGLAPVRDSKTPHGPALLFPADAWTAFVAGLTTNGFPAAD